MASRLLRHRLMVAAGGAALVGMGMFTAACSTSNEAPSTTTETTITTTTTTTTPTTTPPPLATTTPEVSPTEKGFPGNTDPFTTVQPTHTQNRHHGDH